MSRINRKGRSKHEPFIMLHRGVTNSSAWKVLTCASRALLIEIWQRHNGTNNGRIALGHRQARVALHIGTRKVTASFRQLEDTGFIIKRSRGSFDWKKGAGERRATEWELTAEPCDGNLAKRDYTRWKIQTTASDAVADREPQQ